MKRRIGEHVIEYVHGKRIVRKDGNSGKVTIVGNGHGIPLQYDRDGNATFRYRGETYKINEFTSTRSVWAAGIPAWLKEYDGYLNDSFFRGALIEYTTDLDSVKVYTAFYT